MSPPLAQSSPPGKEEQGRESPREGKAGQGSRNRSSAEGIRSSAVGTRSSEVGVADFTLKSCDICRQSQILQCLPCWPAHAALLPAACFSRLPFLAAGSFCCWLPASHDGTQEWGPGVRKVKICVMASVEVRGPATQPGWQDHKSRKGPIGRRRSLPARCFPHRTALDGWKDWILCGWLCDDVSRTCLRFAPSTSHDETLTFRLVVLLHALSCRPFDLGPWCWSCNICIRT